MSNPVNTQIDTTPGTPARAGEAVDRVGVIASSVCAVHCSIAALLPVAFGALGLGFVLGHEFEYAFTLIAVVFAGFALLQSWRRHRSRLVATFLVLGIAGLLTARGLEMLYGHAHGHHHETTVHADRDVHGATEGGSNAMVDHRSDHERTIVEDANEAHIAPISVGIIAGLLLVTGHIINIRTGRRCREECSR